VIRILLLLCLAAPLCAQEADTTRVVTVDGREVTLNLQDPAQAAVNDSLLVWRAAHVAESSGAIVARLDSAYAAVLDSTGITLLVDLSDETWTRLVVPSVERLLIAARAQWVADGAEAVAGDTIRASERLSESGLVRLEPFWGISRSDTVGVQ